jgi:hypothetical protein
MIENPFSDLRESEIVGIGEFGRCRNLILAFRLEFKFGGTALD